MIHEAYTLRHCIRDTLRNIFDRQSNKSSDRASSSDSDADGYSGGPTSSHSVVSRDFDVSSEGADAFRGVFGDDNA